MTLLLEEMDKKGQLSNLFTDIKDILKSKTYGIDQIRSPDVQALIEPNSIRLLQLDHENSKKPITKFDYQDCLNKETEAFAANCSENFSDQSQVENRYVCMD